MSWRRQLAKIRARFHAPDDLAEEIRAHIAFEERENLEAGMTPEEARARARQRFGNTTLTQERSRDMWTWTAPETLWQDIRYALRQLGRNKGFTAVAVITLALGIGANTAIFSVVNATLLTPPPFKNPEWLVQLFETEKAPGNYPLNSADYLEWQAQNHSFESSSLYDWGTDTSVGGSGEPERGVVTPTQANFFDVLDVKPLFGRTFASGEDSGKHNVAVLSYGFWQRHFAGEEDVLSKAMKLDGETYNVIGVMPRWFRFPVGVDVWRPLDMRNKDLARRGDHNWNAIARIKPNVTLAQARQDLLAISQRLEKQYPNFNNKVHAVLIPLKERLIGDSRSPLLILLGAVLLVLLIACANVANLLLARATVRQREMALRATLGAGRLRLLRQLLTESLILALLGAALGLLGAWYCVRLLDSSTTVPIPHTNPLAIDGNVLLFTIIVSVTAGILFGLAPALQTRESRLNQELKSGAQSILSASGGGFLRNALVVGEIALTLALLIGAGLLLRSFAQLRNTGIGIDPRNLVTAGIVLPHAKYEDFASRRAFFDEFLKRVRALPGVEDAALSSEIPLEGHNNGYVDVNGDRNHSYSHLLVGFDYVSPDYFRTLGIPVLRGRGFTDGDMNQAASVAQRLFELFKVANGPVTIPPGLTFNAVISETTARTFWPNQNAIGKHFGWSDVPVIVIGVVGDVKEYRIRDNMKPQVYLSYSDKLAWYNYGTLSVKTRRSPLSIVPALRARLRALDNSLALFRPRTMEQVIASDTQDTQFQTVVLGSFAAIALVLATIGLYGVMSYVVTQRTREIGIRMALGAKRTDMLRLVLLQGARLTCAGLLLGTLAAFALTRTLSSVLFGVRPFDPLTYFCVAVLLAVVTLAAYYIPARRATEVEPILALRHE
jgi:putative ABC transport system permease protein